MLPLKKNWKKKKRSFPPLGWNNSWLHGRTIAIIRPWGFGIIGSRCTDVCRNRYTKSPIITSLVLRLPSRTSINPPVWSNTEAHVVPHSIRVELPGWQIDTKKSTSLSGIFKKKDQSWELCPVFGSIWFLGCFWRPLTRVRWEIKSKVHPLASKMFEISTNLKIDFLSQDCLSTWCYVMRPLCYTLFSSLFWLGKILISTILLPHRSGYIEFEIAGKRVTRCIQKKLHAILLQSGEDGRFSHNI